MDSKGSRGSSKAVLLTAEDSAATSGSLAAAGQRSSVAGDAGPVKATPPPTAAASVVAVSIQGALLWAAIHCRIRSIVAAASPELPAPAILHSLDYCM